MKTETTQITTQVTITADTPEISFIERTFHHETYFLGSVDIAGGRIELEADSVGELRNLFETLLGRKVEMVYSETPFV